MAHYGMSAARPSSRFAVPCGAIMTAHVNEVLLNDGGRHMVENDEQELKVERSVRDGRRSISGLVFPIQS